MKLHCPEEGFSKYCSEEKMYSKLILFAFGVKSNSKTEALNVFDNPKAVFKSESPVQPIPLPSSEKLVLGPTAEFTLPVERIIPSAKGNAEPFELKYP